MLPRDINCAIKDSYRLMLPAAQKKIVLKGVVIHQAAQKQNPSPKNLNVSAVPRRSRLSSALHPGLVVNLGAEHEYKTSSTPRCSQDISQRQPPALRGE